MSDKKDVYQVLRDKPWLRPFTRINEKFIASAAEKKLDLIAALEERQSEEGAHPLRQELIDGMYADLEQLSELVKNGAVFATDAECEGQDGMIDYVAYYQSRIEQAEDAIAQLESLKDSEQATDEVKETIENKIEEAQRKKRALNKKLSRHKARISVLRLMENEDESEG